MTPNEYRKKHKRCGTCKYWQPTANTYYSHPCDCKVQNVNKYSSDGRFCRVYKANEFEK